MPRGLRQRSSDHRDCSRLYDLFLPTALLVSCVLLGVTETRAQDVAEAARQERARKQSQPKRAKHVYAEDDLARGKILMPEDEPRFEVKKKDAAVILAEKTPPIPRTVPGPQEIPLGDIAREFRRQRQERQLQEALARKAQGSSRARLKINIAPLVPPVLADRRPSQGLPRPRRFTWMRGREPLIQPSIQPVIRSLPRPMTRPSVQPWLPLIRPETSALEAVTVKRGDSLWKLARQRLGHGSLWHELLETNPSIVDPNRISAGSRIYLPANASTFHSASKILIRKGDTLWGIAQRQLGRASAWRCIAQANPQIKDANLIYADQELSLPNHCTP